jgi:NADH-quinone oxidoreductase subunit L
LNQAVFAKGALFIGGSFWRGGDQKIIDGWVVNGSAKLVSWIASIVRQVQSGYLYHYAFAMIVCVIGIMTWTLYTHLGSIK